MMYMVEDMANGNKFFADKYDMYDLLMEEFDTDQDGVSEAIENLCDVLTGRVEGPDWGSDFLSVYVQEVNDEGLYCKADTLSGAELPFSVGLLCNERGEFVDCDGDVVPREDAETVFSGAASEDAEEWYRMAAKSARRGGYILGDVVEEKPEYIMIKVYEE